MANTLSQGKPTDKRARRWRKERILKVAVESLDLPRPHTNLGLFSFVY